MSRSSVRALAGWWALMSLFLLPCGASACATCFGASDSALVKGMNFGILSLLLVILGVLGGVASFFVYLIRRSASFEASTGDPVSNSNLNAP